MISLICACSMFLKELIMREFTDKEKELIEKLISFKQTARLEELQVARLLRKELQCFAVKWSINPIKIQLYSYKGVEDSSKIDWDSLRRDYFKLVDFMYFIEELESASYVKMQVLPSKDTTDEERILYDKSKFKYIESCDEFWSRENNGISYFVPIEAKHIVKTYMVDYLEKYANKIVYPLPVLEDLYDNEYKSLEQRNFDKQMNKTNLSLGIAFSSVLVSAVVPFILDKCSSPTKIDDAQLGTIKNAIIESKSVVPDSINISYSDTLKIRTIMPKKNK